MIILAAMLGLSGLWYEIAKKTDAKGLIVRPLDDRDDRTRYPKPRRSEDPIRELGWVFAFIVLLLYFFR